MKYDEIERLPLWPRGRLRHANLLRLLDENLWMKTCRFCRFLWFDRFDDLLWSSYLIVYPRPMYCCFDVLAWCMYIVITADYCAIIAQATHKQKTDKNSGLLSKCIPTSMQHAPSCTTVTSQLPWFWEFSRFRISSLLFKELGEDYHGLSGVVTLKVDSPVSQGADDPTWCSSRLRGRSRQMDELERQPIFISNHPLVTLADSQRSYIILHLSSWNFCFWYYLFLWYVLWFPTLFAADAACSYLIITNP